MNKYVKSEKGNTLMIVLGFVIVLSLVIAPLALRTSTGLLQAHSGGLKESAYSDAYSAMTLFAKLYEEARSDTEFAFGGLSSEEEWIALMDTDIKNKVLHRYPKVAITRIGVGQDAEWIFSAKSGPSVATYEQTGSYYRSGHVAYSLKASGSSNPLPTLPPDTGGGDEDGDPPSMPLGGKIMLKAVGQNKEMQYNKMFVACTVSGSGLSASGQTPKALIPEALYFDNRHDDQRAGTAEDPKFNQIYGEFLDYYTDINDRVDAYPFYAGSQSGSDDPRLQSAKSINQSAGSELNVPSNTWPATWSGNVTVNGKQNDSSVRIHSFAERIFISNNLTFRPGSNEVLNVEVQVGAPTSGHGIAVGGNMTLDAGGNNARIVIGHGIYVKGDFAARGNSNWEVIIKGDLIVGGNFDLNVTSFKNFIVEGDIIVGGNAAIATSNSVNGMVDIKGSLQAGGNVTIAPHPVISIGKDLLSGGKTEFMNMIGRTITIGRNFASKGDILMQGSNGSNHLLVGNHMISNGNIRFDSQSNQWNANIEVGDTLAAAGNVYAVKNINGKLVVKENVIVGKDFGLPQNDQSMDGSLLLDQGNLIIFGDAYFGRNLNGKYNRLMVQGIAIKGYVKFDNNDYNNNHSVNSASICITGLSVP